MKTSKPTSKLEIITPELASKWLSKNKNNRHITKNSIESYSKAMLRGEWVPNTQAIGFDIDGNLIDGQHRLYAIAASGTTIESFVVRGLAANTFTTIDIGRRRRSSDFLSIYGHINSTTLAATLSWLYAYKKNAFKGIRVSRNISHSELIEALEEYHTVPETIKYILHISKKTRILSPSGAMALCHIFSTKCPNEAREFFRKLYTGSNLSEDSPILHLRNYQINLNTNRVFQGKTEIVIAVIKTWNAYINNKPMTYLRILPTEQVPEIEWGQSELKLSA